MKLRKEQIYVMVVFLVVFVCGYLMFVSAKSPEYTSTHVLRYSFSVINPESIPVEYAGFWAYAPLPQTATQRRSVIKTSHPYKLQRDSDGNEKLYFMLGTLAPYATKVVSVDVEVHTSDIPNIVSSPDSTEYIQPERFIESDTDEIRNLGGQLDAWSSISATRNIYDWVSTNLSYAGYLADDMGARYALRNKTGDCSEYAYLVTALSRATDRRARVMAGFVVTGSGVLAPAGYHNWSEVYFRGTWHLVDAQRGSLENNLSNYIAFRVVNPGSTQVSEDINSQRLFGTELPISVRMNGKGF